MRVADEHARRRRGRRARRSAGATFGVLLGVVASIAVQPDAAHACSTCTVGDPTLTVMGAEQPTRGRLRLSAMLRWRRERVEDGPSLTERRLELGVAYAPVPRITFALGVPLVSRRARFANLAEERSFGLGDVELRVRATLFRDRELAPRHLLAGVVGVELPTAVRTSGPYRDDAEQQPGSRSWDPVVGVTYGLFAAPWSMHVVAVVVTPASEGVGGVRAGVSGRGSLRAQWQPRSSFGLALGLDGRVDAREHVDGLRVDESGGAILYGTLGLVASPSADVVFDLRLSVPIWQRLRGGHVEGVVLLAGVAFDA